MRAGRLPDWFKQKMPNVQAVTSMEQLVTGHSLHTVCQSAHCPNSGECFSGRTATFLILGDICTRRCAFCAVAKGIPTAVVPDEASRVRNAALSLGLAFVVVTSVTRDDLFDGGAAHFALVVRELHGAGILVEILVPDFKGAAASIESVMTSCPEVLNHNIETVPRLYGQVRPSADYDRSLALLYYAKQLVPGVVTKSGLMVGIGETRSEIEAVMADLLSAGCDSITIGQYLQPSSAHRPVDRYVTPEEFEDIAGTAKALGFRGVASGPLVRSSYRASQMYECVKSAVSR